MRGVLLMGLVLSCGGSGAGEDGGLAADTGAADTGAADTGAADTGEDSAAVSDATGADAAPCVPSGPERCDGVDNDCNGEADDGFVLRCTAVEPEVVEAELTGDGFSRGVVRNLLRGNDVGIALPALPDRSEFIWVAASSDNLVSKIRVADGVEVGRFVVGDDPSRTAVDGNGDAWVAMRGDLNDNGDPEEPWENVVKIDGSCTPAVAPPMATRECVLLDIPEVGNLLRGVAIDARGDVWVGAHATGEVIRLDGRSGEILERIRLDPFARPYGLAIDEAGYLWVAAITGDAHVLRVDPVEGIVDVALDFDQLERHTPYGIAADGAGGVWFGSRIRDVFRVDAETFELSHVHDVGTATRGVAIDDRGYVWTADSSRDALIAADPESGEVLYEVAVGRGPVGVAVDHDGFVWGANLFDDSVSKVDPVTGDLLGTFPVGRTPYTYSDMTGSAFRVFRRLRGVFRGSYGVGVPGARWTLVRVEGEIGDDAVFRMRAADSLAGLSSAAWSEVNLSSGEATLDLRGSDLEVEVTLQTEDRAEPPPFVESLRFTVEFP
ncbi:MAG: hypothetical protein AAGE52_41695 [Myxococcota bacterium]